LEEWIAPVILTAADTLAIAIHKDVHVATIAPVLTPRISHDPVLIGALVTKADEIHSVVVAESTAVIVEAALVLLEGCAASVDADAHGLNHESVHEWLHKVSLALDACHFEVV